MSTRWVYAYLGRNSDTPLEVLVGVERADPEIGVPESIEIKEILFPDNMLNIMKFLGKETLQEIYEQVLENRDFIVEGFND